MTLKQCILSVLVVIFLILLACRNKNPLKPEEKKCEIPDQLCDSALLVVGNKTNDTIHFNKGEGGTNVKYYLSVKPGGTTTVKTSGTDVRFNSDCSVYRFSGPIQGVQIPTMYFSVKMNRCTKKVYFIKKSNNSIDLEIEDKD
jgi:hypothetical protein